MDPTTLKFIEHLTAGNSFMEAGLLVGFGFLLTQIRSITGAPQAFEVLLGRFNELKKGQLYELLSKVVAALVGDGSTDPAAVALKGAAMAFLEQRRKAGVEGGGGE